MYAIQPKKEGRRCLASALILLAMLFQNLKNERNAVLRLVINDLRHDVAHVSRVARCGETKTLSCEDLPLGQPQMPNALTNTMFEMLKEQDGNISRYMILALLMKSVIGVGDDLLTPSIR